MLLLARRSTPRRRSGAPRAPPSSPVASRPSSYLLAGSLSFGLTESFQRLLRGVLGAGNGLLLNTPILILSSAAAVAICTVAVCPFEAVRIRSVSASGGGAPKSAQECFDEIYAEGGAAGFFAGLGPILLKEAPFFITKFVVYDAMSTYLLSAPSPLARLRAARRRLPPPCSRRRRGRRRRPRDHPATWRSRHDTGGVTLQQAVERLRPSCCSAERDRARPLGSIS